MQQRARIIRKDVGRPHGTTSYTYKTAGAGQVATVDGPLSNDTIAYTYDELGRVIQRTINGTANQVDWTFDALGRVTSEENLLGEFTYTYHGVTNRLTTVTYPNGQTSTYSYLDDDNDHRLQTIHHKYPNTSTLSKFDYTYDAVGNILTWRQQADTTAVLWKYGYDPADQLIAAVKHATDTPQTVLQRFAYAYDPAGNRTVEQIDDAITLSAYDNLNRLTSQAPGGPMVIAGSLNEPGTVTIAGVPVTVDAGNNFRGTVPTTTGTNTFTIVAKDATGNTTTQQYEVGLSGTARTLTYDANGNLTADGTRTFERDARNQLVATQIGTDRIELMRDGGGFVADVKKLQNGVVTSQRGQVRCGLRACEERPQTGSPIRYFAGGRSDAAGNAFYAADHLSTLRVVTGSAGQVTGRADFDPFGRIEAASTIGDDDNSFAGQRLLSPSDPIFMAAYREYDPSLGRWTSEDPIGFTSGSPNFYSYVEARALTAIDPSGLVAWDVDTKITYVDTTMLGAAKACQVANPICGCTTYQFLAAGECKCENGQYKMTLSLTYKNPTIHIARDAWTPMWVIRRHEEGHASDHQRILQERKTAGELLEDQRYGSKDRCEFEKDKWAKSVEDALRGAARGRDVHYKRLCG